MQQREARSGRELDVESEYEQDGDGGRSEEKNVRCDGCERLPQTLRWSRLSTI